MTTKKLAQLGLFLTLGFILIGCRLFQLQIHLSERFFKLGQRNFLRSEKISSPRGNILDRRGNPLATNRPVTKLFWQGIGKRNFDQEQLLLIEHLQNLLLKTIDREQLLIKERSCQRLLLHEDLNFETLSRIIEHYPVHPNIIFTTSYKRDYPHGAKGCHLIGYLGSITSAPSGKMGLEKIFEEDLKGSPGEIRKTVNSKGHQLAREEIQKARKGADLITTVDLELQLIAEELFPEEFAGVLIAMNPKNGGLNVVVSRPSFDPNIFMEPLENKTWNNLQQEKQPFLNRAFTALYPPASLFKLVTISAALEHGLAEPDTNWNCHGYCSFAGRNYYCARKTGHGPLSTLKAVAVSCNIPFFELGKRMKIDQIADYAYRFGLGQKTNTTFPEKAGLVPTSAWKKESKGEPWWPGETLSAAIGQSFLLVTPIQMACMVSAIVEGYLVRPCIVESEAILQAKNEKRSLEIAPKTREFLKESMIKVVKDGTGQRLNKLENLEIYAKTGTAQTSSLEKRTFGERYREHAWFICHMSYKESDPMTLLVILEHAESSVKATNLAMNFISRYCKVINQRLQSSL